MLPFGGKETMQSFVRFSIMFFLYETLRNRRSISSYFLIFNTSEGISSSPAIFLEKIKFYLRKQLKSSLKIGWRIVTKEKKKKKKKEIFCNFSKFEICLTQKNSKNSFSHWLGESVHFNLEMFSNATPMWSEWKVW